MTFSEPAGAGSTPRPRSVALWAHRSSRGLEIGQELPSGKPQNAVVALLGAFATTWQLRKTLWILVLKEFKSRYRAQALGLLWSFAYPLIMMGTITLAFQYILHIRIKNFVVFYLIAAVFWQWFSNATLAATGSFVENAALVKRTAFPRYLFPVAAVLANGINFVLEWILVFGFYFFFPAAYHFSFRLLALLPLCGLELILLVGVGLCSSALNVRYRDVYYIVTSILTLGFWLSPLLYSTDMAPPLLRKLLRLNPLAGVMEGARSVVMHAEWPTLESLLPSVTVAIGMFLIGCAIFRRQNLALADHV